MPIIVIVCKYLKMFIVEMNFTHPELELLSTKTGSEPRVPSCWNWGKEEGKLSTSGVQPCANKGNMGLVVGDHCVLGLSELCLTWFHRNTENPETAQCILATGWIRSLYHRLSQTIYTQKSPLLTDIIISDQNWNSGLCYWCILYLSLHRAFSVFILQSM